jgi:hypothetical protein
MSLALRLSIEKISFFQSETLLNSWRSDIGKLGRDSIINFWNSDPLFFGTEDNRAAYVKVATDHMSFVYEDPAENAIDVSAMFSHPAL